MLDDSVLGDCDFFACLYEARKRFNIEFGPPCSKHGQIIEKIEALWSEMEKRFWLGHWLGKLVSRDGVRLFLSPSYQRGILATMK